jgi:hypothetical protein
MCGGPAFWIIGGITGSPELRDKISRLRRNCSKAFQSHAVHLSTPRLCSGSSPRRGP